MPSMLWDAEGWRLSFCQSMLMIKIPVMFMGTLIFMAIVACFLPLCENNPENMRALLKLLLAACFFIIGELFLWVVFEIFCFFERRMMCNFGDNDCSFRKKIHCCLKLNQLFKIFNER